MSSLIRWTFGAAAMLSVVVVLVLDRQQSDYLIAPIEADGQSASIAEARRGWYTQHLRAMGEPRLLSVDGDSVRFLWLRTFHHPLTVRITCDAANCVRVAKRLDGAGGYEPGALVEESVVEVDRSEFLELESALSKAGFWNSMPASRSGISVDGARWILEARRGNVERVWDVQSASASHHPEFRQICEEMIAAAELFVSVDEVY